jgi:phenylacetate-coenzyme A ligase PaaK-like adenylate-forming protein
MKAPPEPFATASLYNPHYPRRCGQALDQALQFTPAYHSWRSFDIGIESGVFSRLASFSALTKEDLRTHGPQGFVPHGRSIPEGLASGEIELATTSGTTGDQVDNVWYQPWWNRSEAASWQLNSHACGADLGNHREAILTSPWCAGVPCENGFLTKEQRTLGRFLYLCERSDPSQWPNALMNRMVDELNCFGPQVLEANPSFLGKLSRHIITNGLRVRSPALIVLTYEFPSILHLRIIRQAFDSPLASSYGSTETGYVFMECEAGRMHQVTESCHVDFLPLSPDQGGPKRGRLLVTTFDNPWRSLVRFDTGDIVRLNSGAPCPCGRHEGLTLTSVEGRLVNLTLTPGNRLVTQGEVDRALSEVPGIVEYQVIQTEQSAYTARFVIGPNETTPPTGAVREAIQAIYGPAATITPEPVTSIAPDPPGKYRLVKSLIPIDPSLFLDDQFAPREKNTQR